MDKGNETNEVLVQDLVYFIAMCGEKDRRLMNGQRRKTEESGRLVCISMALGLRSAMLRLFSEEGEDVEPLLAYIDGCTLVQVKNWMTEFIAGIDLPPLWQAAEGTWKDKLKKLREDKFSVRDLL